MKILPSALLAIVLSPALLPAQTSPAIGQQGWYADPEIHIYNGEYWIYPTYSSDLPDSVHPSSLTPSQQARRNQTGLYKPFLTQTFLDAFSSPDLVHWTKHAHVLDVKDVPWAAYAVWAPTSIHLNGKYYVIFGANDIQKSQTAPGGLGLAVSGAPGGPFVDAIGAPLIGHFENGAQPIDAFVMKDDDGSVYLYYGGQGHCNVTRLSPDLRQILGLPDGTPFEEITPEHYVEGSFVVKRRGTYYFMWSEGDWGDSSYRVAYAKSSSPTGPFQRIGTILQSDPAVATGAGHHSVLQIPGTDEWYIVYHRHPLGDTNPNHRVLAIDRMEFDAAGDIKPVQMTRDGVSPRVLSRREKKLAAMQQH